MNARPSFHVMTAGMRRCFFLSLLLACTTSVRGQIFVSPAGDDVTGNGSIDLPYLTLAKAVTLAGPDSIVYMRGGTHHYTAKVTMSATGSAGHYIKIWAYQNEKPVIDFTGIATSTDGITINGSYYYLKGIDISKATHNAVRIAGHYNILEQCTFRECGNSGLLMGSNSSTANPSHNLILNCDAYKNFDPPVGGNADGMSAKWNIGVGNQFTGCRSWNNSDDGWDLWMATNPVLIDHCWAFRNGVDIWHTGSVSGNGNGIKLGGSSVATYDTVWNCLSFDNAGNTGRGFDENNNLAGQTLYNCTAFRNTGDNFHFTNTLTKGSHLIRNCVSSLGVVNITSGTIDHNSWQGFTVTDADFMSFDTNQAVAPRQADGSLPDMTFMHLAPGSDLIGAGVPVPRVIGDPPDLGAFPFELPLPIQLALLAATLEEGKGVRIEWTTLSEVDNYGFYVQCRCSAAAAWTEVQNGFVAGHGTTGAVNRYVFVDAAVGAGAWLYRLRQVDLDGAQSFSDAVHVSVLTDVRVDQAPIRFGLQQNFPNPFNPSTEIGFSVDITARTTLTLFNLLGQRVVTLFDDVAAAGRMYTVRLSSGNLSSGVYFYRLRAGDRVQTKKLTVMR